MVDIRHLTGNMNRKIFRQFEPGQWTYAAFPRKGSLPLLLQVTSQGRNGVVTDNDRIFSSHRIPTRG